MPAGRHELEVNIEGFEPFLATGLQIREGGNLRVDAQLGETITAKEMTATPLNGRSFTDLPAMQAGVVPISSQQPNAVVMSGWHQHTTFGRSQCRKHVHQRPTRDSKRLRH